MHLDGSVRDLKPASACGVGHACARVRTRELLCEFIWRAVIRVRDNQRAETAQHDEVLGSLHVAGHNRDVQWCGTISAQRARGTRSSGEHRFGAASLHAAATVAHLLASAAAPIRLRRGAALVGRSRAVVDDGARGPALDSPAQWPHHSGRGGQVQHVVTRVVSCAQRRAQLDERCHGGCVALARCVMQRCTPARVAYPEQCGTCARVRVVATVRARARTRAPDSTRE